MAHIQSRAGKLLKISLAHNTSLAYKRAITAFEKFRMLYSFKSIWPVPVSENMLFISYCYECGLASSTIKSYIAGVSFAHKIRNCPDSTKHFVVKKILEGYSKVAQKPDARLPITCSVLAKICNGLLFGLILFLV